MQLTTNNLLLDQVSNSKSLTFTIFWNQNIKISLHVYGLEKRFKCEMKNTKKIQFENSISNKVIFHFEELFIISLWLYKFL